MPVPWTLCMAIALSSLAAPIGQAANTCRSNPLGIAYQSTRNVPSYAHPGGMLIAGDCNQDEPAFAAARAAGTEILVYVDPVEVRDRAVCALDREFYQGDGTRVPRWPWPTEGARRNYPGTRLTDIRAGSAWSDRVVAYVEQMMRDDKVDGVFLDVVGARLWSTLADWPAWPQEERDAWTDGNVDLVRRLDASRRAINPHFIIVNNNVWDRGDTRGIAGEMYVDGIVLEHPPPGSAYHKAYVARAFGDLGQRRVLVIASNPTEARAWAATQGVTHVASQQTYAIAALPVVPFNRLADRRGSPGTACPTNNH